MGLDLNSLKVPVIYVGEKQVDEPKILGIQFRFQRGVPQPVPARFANLLMNRGNYRNVSDVDMADFRDPVKAVTRVLVARTLHSIGDMLMASLTPKAIKRKYPRAQVDVAVPRESFPLWLYNPWVDHLIAWGEPAEAAGTRTADYDLFWDITRPCVRYEMANWPSKKSRVDIYMEHCGCQLPDDEKQPFYLVTPDERSWAREITGGRFFFGLQLRANAPIRNWMAGAHCPQDRNQEIVRRWLGLDNGVDILLFDQHRELIAKYPDDLRLFKHPGSTLRQIGALVERCALMLTLDSGLLHWAGALSVPVVALFGNIHPACRTAYYQHVISLFHPEACDKAPCFGACGRQVCLEAITVDEVWDALLRNWEAGGKRRLELLKAQDQAMTVKPEEART